MMIVLRNCSVNTYMAHRTTASRHRHRKKKIRLAELIASRGITYTVEWWHNTAGVICGAEEYLYDGDAESLKSKVEKIMPQNAKKALNGAKEAGITPTEFVYRYCEDILYK